MNKLVAALMAVVAGIASAHGATSGGNPSGVKAVPLFNDISLSETDDLTPIAGNSVACHEQHMPPRYTRENHYWRRFYLSEYPDIGPFVRFLSVDIGVEQTNGLDVTVNLYETPDDQVPPETINLSLLTFLGSGVVSVPAGTALTTVNVPISGSLMDVTNADVVVEIVTPDGSTNDQVFYVGSTTSPETHVSFFSAPFCDELTPVPTAEIGYPDMHVIMVLNTTDEPDLIFASDFEVAP
ncbi:MAG: hypothetical protein WBV61_09905 [Rhodanobacteraceae bacterium]